MKSDMKYFIFIIFLTIFGGFLRFYRLDYNSLWLDEVSTVFFTTMSPIEYWNFLQNMGDVHPPLFYIVERFFIILGNTEFYWRLAPAIFGTISIPIYYFIGKKLFDCEIGCLMAILLCFSPFNVYYSQEARMYSMLLFLTSVTFLFFLYALNSEKIKYWVLFAVFSVASIYTHFFSIIFITPLIIYAVFFEWKQKKCQKNVIISLIILCLLCLPLLTVTLNLFQTRSTGSIWGYTGIDYLINILISLTTSNPSGMLFLLLLFFIGLIMLIITDLQNRRYIIAVFFFILIMILILSEIMPMMRRYIIFLFPFFFAIAGYSYTLFKKRIQPQHFFLIFTILIILASTPQLSAYYTHVSKTDWRQVSIFIDSSTSTDDLIIIIPEYNNLPFEYYYNSTKRSNNIFFVTNSSKLEDLDRIRTDKNVSMFIIYTGDLKAANPSGETIGWISNHTIIEKQLFGVDIVKVIR